MGRSNGFHESNTDLFHRRKQPQPVLVPRYWRELQGIGTAFLERTEKWTGLKKKKHACGRHIHTEQRGIITVKLRHHVPVSYGLDRLALETDVISESPESRLWVRAARWRHFCSNKVSGEFSWTHTYIYPPWESQGERVVLTQRTKLLTRN